jgi:hypothetical protein
LKTVWKKRRNPWKSLKCIRWSKLLPFELWKISHALSGPCGGLLNSDQMISKVPDPLRCLNF